MNREDHAKQLGQLFANLQSLEFALRAFLQKLPSARPLGIPHGSDIYAYPIGAELPENELTSYDSLGELIVKFNNEMKSRGISGIDPGLVEIRDALAHGRVSAASPNARLRLLKFDRPVNGKVRIVFNEEMSESWFSSQIKRVHDAVQFVVKNIKP